MSHELRLVFKRWQKVQKPRYTRNNDPSQPLKRFLKDMKGSKITPEDLKRIYQLEEKNHTPITEMIISKIDMPIAKSYRCYGFTPEERKKWSFFFYGDKYLYERICRRCGERVLAISTGQGSDVCLECKRHVRST